MRPGLDYLHPRDTSMLTTESPAYSTVVELSREKELTLASNI
jgi:hypothetical protein